MDLEGGAWVTTAFTGGCLIVVKLLLCKVDDLSGSVEVVRGIGTVGALSWVTTESTRGCLIVVKLLPCVAVVDLTGAVNLTGAVGAERETGTVGALWGGREELLSGKSS